MVVEKIIPICWEEFDDGGYLTSQFYDAQFTDDFGPFRFGDVCHTLAVNLEEGFVQEYLSNGLEGRSCKIKLIAID